MATHVQIAEEFYVKHYKGRGIAPKHVIALKEVLSKASRKGEKLAVAARTLIKEKGITLKEVGEKPAPKAVKKTHAPADEVEVEAPKVKKSFATVKPKDMDVKSLRGTLDELKRAGISKVGYSSEDKLDVLRDKVNGALSALTSPKSLEVLKKIAPSKLTKLKLGDCLGLFVDMRTPSCVSCPTQGECVKEYIKNVGNNFAAFKAATKDIKKEAAAKAVTDKHVAVKKVKTKKKISESTAVVKKMNLKSSRPITVNRVPNYAEGGDDEVMIARILKEKPETLGALRKILNRYYEVEQRSDFKDWVKVLRNAKIIKLQPVVTE